MEETKQEATESPSPKEIEMETLSENDIKVNVSNIFPVEEELPPENKENSPKPYLMIILIATAVGIMIVVIVASVALSVGIPVAKKRNEIDSDSYTNYSPKGIESILLISIDAFRWSYMVMPNAFNDSQLHPRLTKLADEGASAPMISVFPSLTFPNHYSIVTGLYSEEHGIISNTIFDKKIGTLFTMGSQTSFNPAWWGGEPIWITAQKNGLKSGVCFWPGSDVEINGMYPTYYMKYNESFTYNERINKILEYMDKDQKDRPNFYALYFNGVDHFGHTNGPWSDEVKKAIKDVDEAIGTLLDEVNKRPDVAENLNIIVTSDHGMTSISKDRVVFVDDFIDISKIKYYTSSSLFLIDPDQLTEFEVYNAFRNVEHIDCYRKSEIPLMYHYRNNDRITPIVLVAKEGWTIGTRNWVQSQGNSFLKGAHGYDPYLPTMRATIIGSGKYFLKGKVAEGPVENINLYSLMCTILGIPPAPNSGSVFSLGSILNNSKIVQIL